MNKLLQVIGYLSYPIWVLYFIENLAGITQISLPKQLLSLLFVVFYISQFIFVHKTLKTLKYETSDIKLTQTLDSTQNTKSQKLDSNWKILGWILTGFLVYFIIYYIYIQIWVFNLTGEYNFFIIEFSIHTIIFFSIFYNITIINRKWKDPEIN